jgi:hypothetical protein
MGSLGDGLLALKVLALGSHATLSECTEQQQRLLDELLYEARRFLVYRRCQMRGRQYISLSRLYVLRKALREA